MTCKCKDITFECNAMYDVQQIQCITSKNKPLYDTILEWFKKDYSQNNWHQSCNQTQKQKNTDIHQDKCSVGD